MKNKSAIILIALFFFSYGAYSQTDTTVYGIRYNYTSYYNNGAIHELGNYTEKKNEKIKHGYWSVFDSTGTELENGYYKKGNKIGVWKEKDTTSALYWTGNYEKGSKNGNWFNGEKTIVEYEYGRKKRTLTMQK